MAYEDARARLVTVLGTVSITSPISESIQRVYADPPPVVQDLPCFILYGSSGTEDWTLGGAALAEQAHTERVRLLLRDEDLDRAAELVRAYRTATLTALKPESGLAGHAVISRVDWEAPAAFSYGNLELTGMDFLVAFLVLAA